MSEIENIPELSSQPDRMSNSDLERWLGSAQGGYVTDWEQAMFDTAVADVFGFNALQIGLPQFDFLRSNRIPLRQKAGPYGEVDARCDFTALPFAAQSLDLVLLPHVLEFSADPHELPDPVRSVADHHLDDLAMRESASGGQRVVDWLSGEPLPRIC